VKSKIESNKYQTRPYNRHGIPEFVRALKSFSARRISRLQVWQRNYFKRIIRNEK